ncbi:hypothetical protein LUZ60_000181 [Juncus effusus]|nr:hypothetical protein LUZ60_000181 [Juncus effusus]
MGFSWDFSGNTLIKRLCKSLLKKKLGDLLLGDIDLDQLDLQLTKGTLNLSDLALNADFINEKLVGSAVMVKEGSMKSLSIKIPLKLKSCEIEIEELELIISPFNSPETGIPVPDCSTSQNNNNSTQKSSPKSGNSNPGSSSRDVDEGVKRIANAVKWFLTSFHIRIKNIYIVFDPSTNQEVRNSALNKSLVFRIKETEFGTCLSEDLPVKLNNFIKFKESAIEFLKMEELEKNLDSNSNLNLNLDEEILSPVLKGPIGGFSGQLNLSIPWKNGSLSLKKLDADLSIDSLELNVNPNCIDWVINVWDSLQKNNLKQEKLMDSSSFNSRLNLNSSGLASNVRVSDDLEKGKEKIQEDFFTGANFIQNYVPKSVTLNDQNNADSDYDDASIDQFFECFDVMRSSQSSIGNSGIWNWTCSVFNAINYADTLASGSDHVNQELLTEKTLHASVSEICIILSFTDEKNISTEKRNNESYMSCNSSVYTDQSSINETDIKNMKSHHLEARFQKIFLDLETYPQNMKLKASIGKINIDEFYETLFQFPIFLNPNLKREIQSSLPPFPFDDSETSTSSNPSPNSGYFRVSLLKSFGKCNLNYTTSCPNSNPNSVSTVSFNLSLPHFTFWVHFHLIHMIMNLMSQIETSFKKPSLGSKTENTIKRSSNKTNSSKSSLKGKIVLSTSRIFLCFPSESQTDFSHPSPFEKFIVFDHFSPLDFTEFPSSKSRDFNLGSNSNSVHLDIKTLEIYLVEESLNQTFSAVKILSTKNGQMGQTGFGFDVSWQTGHGTGQWINSRVWNLALLHEQYENKRHDNSKGSGFSSSTSLKDIHEKCANIRQELILSAQYLFHAKFHNLSMNFSKKNYLTILSLIDQVLEGFSNDEGKSKTDKSENYDFAPQISFLFECGALNVSADFDELIQVSHLLQRELEGSWSGAKLSIKNFELLSVSNIGGLKNSQFFYINHGEGKLYGSILNSEKNNTKNFLLVSCADVASGRGDGFGTNALNCEKSGISFTTIVNPTSHEKYTSVIINGGTIIAPGGRFDWFNSIISFFTQKKESNGTDTGTGTGMKRKSYFYLDLVDVALSYEPHERNNLTENNNDNKEVGPSCFFEAEKDSEKRYIACLLAASSLSLSNRTDLGSICEDYNIQLQDLGFLICRSDGTEITNLGQNPNFLKQFGYVRIMQNALISAVLRMSDSFWKFEVSDSSFKIATCHDTFFGLIKLISQLNQIYAPDMQEAIAHLQSRWKNNNSNKSKQNEGLFSEFEISEGGNEKSPLNCETGGGILDEILENAFYTDDEKNKNNNPFEYYTVNLPFEKEKSDLENDFSNSPKIIDSYYLPDSPATSASDEITGTGTGWYSEGSLNILEDHISEFNLANDDNNTSEYFDVSDSAEPFCVNNLKGRVVFANVDVNFRVFGGDDWSNENPNLGFSGRDEDSCLEFSLLGLDLNFDLFPDEEIIASKMCISAKDMNLFDRSGNAPWKMVLGRYNSKEYIKESSSKAFKLEMESIRPEPPIPLEDYRLQLEISPLRLHLDQGQLNFIVKFFENNKNNNEIKETEITVAQSTDLDKSAGENNTDCSESQTIVEEALLPFFQKFDVRPLVIKVDYIPRQFDPVSLSRGNYAELLNLVPWKGIDLKLKNVSAVGVYGFGSICETVLGEWLEDISHNQVHKLIKGLPPLKSLLAVSSGTSKLFSLPLKSYKKDGKLLKGMQRGAVAFIRSVSIEAVGLGVHLAAGAHEILLKTESVLAANPPAFLSSSPGRKGQNSDVRTNQPEDAQQGMQQAYESLTEGIGRSASALIGTPLKAYQRGAGAGSALASAFKSAPSAVVAPVSASARAVHYALLGLRNSLDPEHKRESMEKYLGPSQS